jgi:hypothetical protein
LNRVYIKSEMPDMLLMAVAKKKMKIYFHISLFKHFNLHQCICQVYQ